VRPSRWCAPSPLDVQTEQNGVDQKAKQAEAKHAQDLAYLRTLILRYMELEDQHEAIFPVIATFFGFTEQEVAKLAQAQQAHAQRNSVWGRTLSAGTFLLGVAQEAAHEVSAANHNRAGAGGGAGAS